MALKSDRDTFSRLMMISKDRAVSMRDTLTFELTPLPLSLANADGTLSKTMKLKLFTEFSKSVEIVDECSENSPPIFDGMVLF